MSIYELSLQTIWVYVRPFGICLAYGCGYRTRRWRGRALPKDRAMPATFLVITRDLSVCQPYLNTVVADFAILKRQRLNGLDHSISVNHLEEGYNSPPGPHCVRRSVPSLGSKHTNLHD